MTFTSPVVANSHYLGKTHAKNMKLKLQSPKAEGTIIKMPGLVSCSTGFKNTTIPLLGENRPGLFEVAVVIKGVHDNFS